MIVQAPKVYMVGRQVIDDAALASFLGDESFEHWTTDTEVGGQKLAEVAGRLCYESFVKPRPGGNAAYIKHILEVGHGSVLEHAVFNLIVTGVSRSFTHDLVRHRAGFGFSQRSQRFVDESDCDFVVPPALRDEVNAAIAWRSANCPKKTWGYALETMLHHAEPTRVAVIGLHWLAATEAAARTYTKLSDYLAEKHALFEDKTLRRKAAREAARSVLPNATETKIFITANARALRHFIEMRAHPAADVEIREVAIAVLKVLASEAPNLFGDYTITAFPPGGETAETAHRKV